MHKRCALIHNMITVKLVQKDLGRFKSCYYTVGVLTVFMFKILSCNTQYAQLPIKVTRGNLEVLRFLRNEHFICSCMRRYNTKECVVWLPHREISILLIKNTIPHPIWAF